MRKLLLFLVPIGIFCCAAGSFELSRQKAAELISKHAGYPQTAVTKFRMRYSKKTWSDPSWLPAQCVVVESYGERLSDMQKQLNDWQSKGLITLGELEEHKGECHYLWVTVQLTDEGKKYLLNESQGVFVLKTHDVVFGEITGILKNEQFKTAEVEYTEKNANFTPFAKDISSVPRGRHATFALWDNGWRIQEN